MTTSTLPKRARLLLVYNADSGIINALKDAVWKMASPSTYPCSLCAITYGAVSMHSDWKRFLASLPLDVVFHHKDDFAEAYPDHGIALPAIVISEEDTPLRVLVPDTVLDETKDTVELMARVEEALVNDELRRPRLKIVA